MRKSIIRAQGLYVTLFTLAATVAQAAPRRRLDPDAARDIFVAILGNWDKVLETVRILEVLKSPIG
ncbi:MAG: hypothetical protein ACRD2J_16900 [Thermoanaerobaculia bacterium]